MLAPTLCTYTWQGRPFHRLFDAFQFKETFLQALVHQFCNSD